MVEKWALVFGSRLRYADTKGTKAYGRSMVQYRDWELGL